MTDEPIVTMREYLIRTVLEAGIPTSLAKEAVSSVALSHPEWEMDSIKPLTEWRRTMPINGK